MTQKRKHGRRAGRGRNKQKQPILRVSDHAIVRFIERVNHVRTDNIRERIVTPELLALHAKLGNGIYQVNGFEVVIENCTVKTVLPQKKKRSSPLKLKTYVEY
jgi:hypothetical protein